MNENDDNDLGVNRTVLMAIGIIAGATSFLMLARCTNEVMGTPAFVQAVEQCNKMVQSKVVVPDPKSVSGTYTYDVTITASPEVLKAVEECHKRARETYGVTSEVTTQK